MVDYVSLAATAERLINQNGRDVSLLRNERTPSDPANPHRGGGTTVTTLGPLRAVLIPFESDNQEGTLVRRNEKRAFVAANVAAGEIETFDQLVDGSTTWKIVDVDTINPGSVRVMYDLQLRK